MKRRHSQHKAHPKITKVRSGIPSFDQIINGGIPLGTVFLIEESSNEVVPTFAKAFLGEGAVSNDLLLSYSEPDLNSEIPDIRRIGNTSIKSDFTVRYETFAKNSEVQEPYVIDLGSIKSDYQGFIQRTLNCTDEDFYHKLWKQVKDDLEFRYEQRTEDTISRVLIRSVFSDNWPQNSLSEIFEFFKAVKTLLRSKNAVLMITVPVVKMQDKLRDIVFQNSDLIVLNNIFGGGQNLKISIYKAPKSANVEENSVFTVAQSLGATIVRAL
jgi:archaellum biogenesis ATPase FlaH